MKSELKSYLGFFLNEVTIKIGDEEFEVSSEQESLLKDYIANTLKVQLNVDQYRDNLKRFPKLLSKVEDLLNSSFSQTKFTQSSVKRLLSSMDPKEISSILKERKPGPGPEVKKLNVEVPAALVSLANTRTAKSAGEQIGRGELAIPLVFLDAQVGGSNTVYDATIQGEAWHVKEGNPQLGIKMGSARGKTFAATNIYRKILKTGVVSPDELGEMGMQKFSQMLSDVFAALQSSGDTEFDSIESLYDQISKEVSAAALGEAAGILWFDGSSYVFTRNEILGVKAFTQGGRAILSEFAKSQVFSIQSKKLRSFEKAAEKEARKQAREKQQQQKSDGKKVAVKS